MVLFMMAKYKCIIIHCGTKDLAIHTDDEKTLLMERIVMAIRIINNKAVIVVFAIIQRPMDTSEQDLHNFEYIRSYRSFNKENNMYLAKDAFISITMVHIPSKAIFKAQSGDLKVVSNK